MHVGTIAGVRFDKFQVSLKVNGKAVKAWASNALIDQAIELRGDVVRATTLERNGEQRLLKIARPADLAEQSIAERVEGIARRWKVTLGELSP